MTPSPVTSNVVGFLGTVPPFQFLSPYELAALAKTISVEYFPKDTLILRAGHTTATSMYVIQKGAVKLAIHTGVGKEFVLDMRSEGEAFGLLSLMGRDVAHLDVTAVEDTLCYTVPAAEVQALIARHADVADFLLRTSVTRYVDRSLKELRDQTRLMGDTERLLYSLTVGEVAKQQPLTCPETATIQETAELMSSNSATSVFVVAPDGRALGVVTDHDFTTKVVAGRLQTALPVSLIMSSPVIAVETGLPVFEALLAMVSHDIHHILVTREGVPAGVLTNHDLLLLQGKSPLNVVRHLTRQETVADLAAAQKQIADLLPLLMREGARASHITRVVASINERVMARILQLAAAKLGPAPVPFCWVTTGSEGRAEQTFKTDQDNGLIYADQATAADEQYFERFASFVSETLAECGYPLCPGGYMASNPAWRQPLAAWKAYFSGWITDAKRRDVEDALIFFDMRAVGGHPALFHELARHNRELLQSATFFKSVLAFISAENKPPIGFFRAFVLERSGEHKDQLDLKLCGTGPIVNAARLFALDAGIDAQNTVDRIRAIEALGKVPEMPWRDLLEAFEFLMLLRLENQIRQSREGIALSNHIRPSALTNLQRSLLREAFQTISKAQNIIDSRFRSAVWAQLGR